MKILNFATGSLSATIAGGIVSTILVRTKQLIIK